MEWRVSYFLHSFIHSFTHRHHHDYHHLRQGRMNRGNSFVFISFARKTILLACMQLISFVFVVD